MENYLELSLKHRPDYQIAKAGVKALEHKEKAERARQYPEIFIAGQFSPTWSSVGESDVGNPYFYNPYNRIEGGVAVGARWRVDFYKTTTADKTEIEKKEAVNKARQAKAGIPILIEKAYLETGAAGEQCETIRPGLTQGRLWASTMQTSFELGNTKAEDLLKAYASFLDARRKFYEAQFKYQMTLAELARQVGNSAGMQAGEAKKK